MKKIWTKPMATVEEFAANEYVAACHDMNRVYKFVCDAPEGRLYYYDSNNSDGVIDGEYKGSGKASLLGTYHPCDEKHEAPTTGDFFDGYVDYNGNGRHDTDENVIVWTERRPWWEGGGLNGHATINLKMDEWETAKS